MGILGRRDAAKPPSGEHPAGEHPAPVAEAGSNRPVGRRRRRIGAAAAALAVVAAAGIAAALLLGPAASAGGRTTPPPWPVPADTVARVHAAGLDLLTAEGHVLHIHQHLSITVDGRRVTVPARIGILVVPGEPRSYSYIHTHDTTGVIHVESPVRKPYRLGQVFTEWDVLLGPGRLGPYQDGRDGDRVAVFVDLRPYPGDPRRLVLAERQDIDIVITTDGSAPAAPTTRYPFLPNY